MLLSRFVRGQLVAFVVVSVLALLAILVNYARIPEQLGVGRDVVTIELANASGLYPKAKVTYRGSEIGQVQSISLMPGGGARVQLQIDDDSEVPADSIAQVRSASVVGEQYVNFVPPAGEGDGDVLDDGDVVAANLTDLPKSTTDVLNHVDALVQSLPLDDLQVVLVELDTAFAGSGRDMAGLIDHGSALLASADESLPETKRLLDDIEPVLATQEDLDADMRSFVASLDDVSTQLAQSDRQFSEIMTDSAPFVRNIARFADRITPVTGDVLDDVADVAEVADAYKPALEHILTLYPALEQAFQSILPVEREDDARPEVNLWFKLGLDPPVCTTGYRDKETHQDPDDLTNYEVAPDDYCKVTKDSKLVVRGARNAACPNSRERGAYAADCGLIFDKAAVKRQNAIRSGTVPNDMNAAEGLKVLAPGGRFFLQQGSTEPAGSLAELLGVER